MALAALYHQSRAPTAYLSIYISRLGFSFEKVQVVLTDQFCQAKHREDKNSTYIYRQDMELFMTEISHVSTRCLIWPLKTNSTWKRQEVYHAGILSEGAQLTSPNTSHRRKYN